MRGYSYVVERKVAHMKKKKVKKLSQTKLLRKYEPELRDIIIKRDGNKCVIAGYRHKCSARLVADHRPSGRKNHSTFLDPRNLSTVCATANMLAQWDDFISAAIRVEVMQREGAGIIEELEKLSRTPKKWDELSIRAHLDNCKRYFLKNKSGCPE